MGTTMTESTAPDARPPGPSGMATAAGAWDGSDAIYASTYRDLLRVAYVLTGSGPAAEDVVHDVVCSVFPRLATLENPPAYLRVAVVNRCRSLHRREVRAPRPTPPDPARLDPGLVELRDQLQRLPSRRRTAIVLRYLCDLPDAEIARILDCREATVRSLVHRGLADLRSTLTEVLP